MIRVAIPNYESDERPDPHWWNNFYDELSHTTAIPFSGNVNEYHELLTDQANDILKEYDATFEVIADNYDIDYAYLNFNDDAKFTWFVLKYS